MKTKFYILAFLALCFFAADSNAQERSAADEPAKALIDRMTTAQAGYDPKTLDAIFTADFIEISPAGEFDPRAKVIDFYKPENAAKAAGISVTVDEDFRSIRFYGDTAIVIAELSFKMTRNGTALPVRKMMLTAVLRKEKKTWKIASAQYTGVRPPAGAAKPQ
ncbi:MAG: nuclear transport factor 2 family protein [Acidobacteria bacterium]|nr:nuclear transport factor 2 family protein [Acidobacteriota bacterium]